MRTSRDTDISDTPENQEHLAVGLPPIEKKNNHLFLVDRRCVLVTSNSFLLSIGASLVAASSALNLNKTLV